MIDLDAMQRKLNQLETNYGLVASQLSEAKNEIAKLHNKLHQISRPTEITISEAHRIYGIARATIYRKIEMGILTKTANEMLLIEQLDAVFGLYKKQTKDTAAHDAQNYKSVSGSPFFN